MWYGYQVPDSDNINSETQRTRIMIRCIYPLHAVTAFDRNVVATHKLGKQHEYIMQNAIHNACGTA